MRAPGGHHFVVDGPHPHAAPRDLLLPMDRNGRTRIQNADRRVLREVLETTHIDVLVLAEAVVLFRRRVWQSVGEHHDVERREYQILPLHQRAYAIEERIEIGEPIVRRIFLSQERRNLRDAHVPKSVNRLKGFGLSWLFPTE